MNGFRAQKSLCLRIAALLAVSLLPSRALPAADRPLPGVHGVDLTRGAAAHPKNKLGALDKTDVVVKALPGSPPTAGSASAPAAVRAPAPVAVPKQLQELQRKAAGAAKTAADGSPEEVRAAAGFLDDFGASSWPAEINLQWALPNETHPEDAREILEKSPGGLHVSVGSERSFIGAALARGSSHLLIADRDPMVVSYGKLNAALLQLARDRAHYRRLRLEADAQEWRRLAAEKDIPQESREILSNAANWENWRDLQRRNPMNSGLDRAFYRSNYLEEDQLFERLKRMADRRRIKAVIVDFKDAARARALVEALSRSGIGLGVLDMSNAWEPGYIGFDAFGAAVEAFGSLARPESVLMVTRRAGRGIGTMCGMAKGYMWEYLGFTFGDVFPDKISGRSGVDAIYRNIGKYEGNRLNPPQPPPQWLDRLRANVRRWMSF